MNRSTISPSHVLATFLILATQIFPRPISGQEPVVRQPSLPVASQQSTVRTSAPASALGFQSPVYYSSGAISESTYVSLADLNGNGKLDILLADSIANDVSVLMGNGNGTFQTPFVFSSGGTIPATVVPIDLNGDGIPDLVVANQTCCSGDATVAVFLGNGDGTFRQPAIYDAGGLAFDNNGLGPAEIAVIDVNRDGKPDIVVATCGAPTATNCGSSDGFIGVLLGNGDGTFQPAISQDEGSPGGTSIAVADVNGDGKPDVLVTTPICLLSTDCPAGGVSVMLGDGTGKFQKGVVYSTGAWAAGGIAIADLNGDGRPDVVVGGCAASNCWAASGTLTVLLGRGDGTFEPAVVYDTPPLPDGIAIADVNLDGKLDVVTPNVISNPSIVILLGNGDGTLQPPVMFPVETSGYSVAIGDLNGDGKPDIVFADLSGDVGVLINNTSSSPFPTTTTLASSLNPSTYGQKIKLTAKVTTSSGSVPTGRVLFTYGIYTIGSAKLNSSGVAMSTLSTLNADTFPLTAIYQGDTNNLGSTSPILNQVVNQATSSATLSSSPNPSNVGQAVTFTATIISPTTKPSGPVTFKAGKTSLGTVELTNGKAELTTSSLPAGSTKVTATYAGDSNIKGSSASVIQVVQQ